MTTIDGAAGASPPAIELEHVSRWYGNVVAVNDISFSLGPGVTVGPLTVVGARSSTYKDLPSRQVCVGNPAKPIKERSLR